MSIKVDGDERVDVDTGGVVDASVVLVVVLVVVVVVVVVLWPGSKHTTDCTRVLPSNSTLNVEHNMANKIEV